MRQQVTLCFSPGQQIELLLPAGLPALSMDEGKRWLDAQFVANGCTPRRPSGKLLLADKLLELADSVGPQGFAADPAWSRDYARAALAALDRAVLRIDVTQGKVGG